MNAVSTLGRVLRIVCYIALTVVVLAVVILLALGLSDICPRIDTGAVECSSEFAKYAAQLAMAAVLLSIFTGLPGLLAIGGVYFLVRDALRRRSGRA